MAKDLIVLSEMQSMQFSWNFAVEAIKEGDVYTIDADACIDCGACEATCPNEAISEA